LPDPHIKKTSHLQAPRDLLSITYMRLPETKYAELLKEITAFLKTEKERLFEQKNWSYNNNFMRCRRR